MLLMVVVQSEVMQREVHVLGNCVERFWTHLYEFVVKMFVKMYFSISKEHDMEQHVLDIHGYSLITPCWSLHPSAHSTTHTQPPNPSTSHPQVSVRTCVPQLSPQYSQDTGLFTHFSPKQSPKQ